MQYRVEIRGGCVYGSTAAVPPTAPAPHVVSVAPTRRPFEATRAAGSLTAVHAHWGALARRVMAAPAATNAGEEAAVRDADFDAAVLVHDCGAAGHIANGATIWEVAEVVPASSGRGASVAKRRLALHVGHLPPALVPPAFAGSVIRVVGRVIQRDPHSNAPLGVHALRLIAVPLPQPPTAPVPGLRRVAESGPIVFHVLFCSPSVAADTNDAFPALLSEAGAFLARHRRSGLMILGGPLVCAEGAEAGDAPVGAGNYFVQLRNRIDAIAAAAPAVPIVVVPSARDVCAVPVHPQPPLSLLGLEALPATVTLAPNPARVVINGALSVALVGADVLSVLRSHISRPHAASAANAAAASATPDAPASHSALQRTAEAFVAGGLAVPMMLEASPLLLEPTAAADLALFTPAEAVASAVTGTDDAAAAAAPADALPPLEAPHLIFSPCVAAAETQILWCGATGVVACEVPQVVRRAALSVVEVTIDDVAAAIRNGHIDPAHATVRCIDFIQNTQI
jgi:hypothetical protein